MAEAKETKGSRAIIGNDAVLREHIDAINCLEAEINKCKYKPESIREYYRNILNTIKDDKKVIQDYRLQLLRDIIYIYRVSYVARSIANSKSSVSHLLPLPIACEHYLRKLQQQQQQLEKIKSNLDQIDGLDVGHDILRDHRDIFAGILKRHDLHNVVNMKASLDINNGLTKEMTGFLKLRQDTESFKNSLNSSIERIKTRVDACRKANSWLRGKLQSTEADELIIKNFDSLVWKQEKGGVFVDHKDAPETKNSNAFLGRTKVSGRELSNWLQGQAMCEDARDFPAADLLYWFKEVDSNEVFSKWLNNKTVKAIRTILEQIEKLQTQLYAKEEAERVEPKKSYLQSDVKNRRRYRDGIGKDLGGLEDLIKQFHAKVSEPNILYSQFTEKVMILQQAKECAEIFAQAPANLRCLVWFTGNKGAENGARFPVDSLLSFIEAFKAAHKNSMKEGVYGLLHILYEFKKISVDSQLMQNKIIAFVRQAQLVFINDNSFREYILNQSHLLETKQTASVEQKV